MTVAEGQFTAYGVSHWSVLALTVVGAVGLVEAARHADPRWVRRLILALAVLTLLLNVVTEVWRFQPAHPGRSLPLQLSDLVPYAAAGALCTRWWWACALTYYWGLALSIQALLTPVLSGRDFPAPTFLAFFAIHVFVVWAAVVLTWGLGERPSWRGYRFTVVVTVCWAATAFVVNRLVGSNYGFLNARPSTASLLDLLGPWPWYLVPEAALVLAGWAAMTLPWSLRAASTRPRP